MKKLTAAEKWYQAGLSKEAAVKRGACPVEFDTLEALYQGSSLPDVVLYGYDSKPYSCDYHTGGSQGAMLRAIAKESLK